jgi:hypothetical protein
MMVRFNSIRQLRQGDGADSDDCSTERVYERECAVVRISAGGPQSSDNSALSSYVEWLQTSMIGSLWHVQPEPRSEAADVCACTKLAPSARMISDSATSAATSIFRKAPVFMSLTPTDSGSSDRRAIMRSNAD